MNGEKQPARETMTLLMLPNDLLLNCLARISRLYPGRAKAYGGLRFSGPPACLELCLDLLVKICKNMHSRYNSMYPTLSLVSKRFPSLLASLELYDTRTLLGCTESCLYVCLEFPDDSKTHWFTLCRRPSKSITHPKPNSRWFTPCFSPYRILKNCTKKKSSENLFVSIPTHESFFGSWSGNSTFIANGCTIYKMGKFLPSVSFMDCRSHTCHKTLNMLVARKQPVVNVLNGKIYVAQGSGVFDPSNWMECFDPKTQIWEHVPSPNANIPGSYVSQSIVMEGKLYMVWNGSRCVVYKPIENKWDEVGLMDVPDPYGLAESSCVIDNLLYGYTFENNLEWYDIEGRSWRVLKGLERLVPKLRKCQYGVELVDYGGKIAVFWNTKKKIWCAEIALERRDKHEIYGKVEWCGVVLTVPKHCYFLRYLAVKI